MYLDYTMSLPCCPARFDSGAGDDRNRWAVGSGPFWRLLLLLLRFPFLPPPLACDPSPACIRGGGGLGWERSGGRERTSYETNGQAQQTRQARDIASLPGQACMHAFVHLLLVLAVPLPVSVLVRV